MKINESSAARLFNMPANDLRILVRYGYAPAPDPAGLHDLNILCEALNRIGPWAERAAPTMEMRNVLSKVRFAIRDMVTPDHVLAMLKRRRIGGAA